MRGGLVQDVKIRMEFREMIQVTEGTKHPVVSELERGVTHNSTPRTAGWSAASRSFLLLVVVGVRGPAGVSHELAEPGKFAKPP